MYKWFQIHTDYSCLLHNYTRLFAIMPIDPTHPHIQYGELASYQLYYLKLFVVTMNCIFSIHLNLKINLNFYTYIF